MRNILFKKINNILDINKNAPYIFMDIQDLDSYIFIDDLFTLQQLNNLVKHNAILEKSLFEDYERLKSLLKQTSSYDELIYRLDQFKIDLNLLNIKQKKVNKKTDELDVFQKDDNYLLNKKKIITDILSKLLKNIEYFDSLNKKSKKLFIEKGKNLLRLATTFICGTINDVKINAPLFLYDVEIEINKNKIKITKASNLIVNEKLIIVLLKELNENTYLKTAINNISDFKLLIEPLIQYSIEEINHEQYQAIWNQESILKYCNKYCIGLFDVTSGKLKSDFIQLITNNVRLLETKMKSDFEHYTKQEFLNKALIQINKPLNIYQKYAVRSAINENTLIYGPPGTGKSEIITSLIANLLINSKSILVVSEKQAALDVIIKRLSKLSIFAFYLKNLEDENLFYDQIEKLSFEMGSFYSDEYKNENLNLKQTYENNDRVKDYNAEIEKFRMILNEDINFSLEKDSRNNDYRDYLISINKVDEFVKTNKTGINQFWEEYQNKFVKLQSPTEFISKVAEFNWFKERYELSEDEINKFAFIRSQINYFLANSEISYSKIENFNYLKQKVNALQSFINGLLLNKDKDFTNELSNDYFFLEKNYKSWKLINKILENRKEKKEIKQFLIKHSATHEKFLIKYLATSSEQAKINLINRYYFKKEISNSPMLFKQNKDKEFYKIFLSCIKEYENIKLFKMNNYLNDLIQLDESIFNPIVIYFYNNKHILKQSFIEFYNKQIMNFDQRVINQYYKYRVNQIERELVNINVYNFEKLNKNKYIIERNIPWLISNYLKNNKDFILNIDEALKNIYIKNIKNILAKSPKEIQDKMELMFKVVRLDVKPRINDFIKKFNDCLKILFPIWISNPELICYYSKNRKGIFDVGIFDEASQMFLERAYPIIYRCKQLIVAGDDKQLRPEKFSLYELEQDVDYRPLVSEIDFDRSESLLDRAKVSYWNTYVLKNHYRSELKELIEFSNINFYNNKLIFTNKNNIKTNAIDVFTNKKAVEKNNINTEEAKKIIEKLKQQISKYNKILIICFTKQQKTYLKKQITKLLDLKIKEKLKTEQLIIRDLSSVQGDEGELVMISVVYSKKSSDYGFLSNYRGSNYLNVAITRAIKKLIVFKSISAIDINVNYDNKYDESIYFKMWIKYLDELKKINKENKPDAFLITKGDNILSFKLEVFKALESNKKLKKYHKALNVNIGTSDIDIAIYKDKINNINLILILDEWKKNITIQDWFEDIDKEEYLKSRNYNVLRIRQQDWLKDKDEILNQIINRLEYHNM